MAEITKPVDILPQIERGEPPTAQQVFEAVASHLFAQGARSVSHRYGVERCLYRGDKGYSCAVGALIPDVFYRDEMDRNVTANAVDDVLSLRDTSPLLSQALKPHERLLIQLQADHDWPDWAERSVAVERRGFLLRDRLTGTGQKVRLNTDFLLDLRLPGERSHG